MPASTQPTCSKVAVVGVVGARRSRAGRAGADRRPARGSSRSARRTCRPARAARPSRRGRAVRERGAEVGAHLLLRVVVVLVLELPLRAAELAAQVHEEVRLDDGDGEPLAVRALVHVVPGVAAGQDAVARPGFGAGREVLVDEQRHHRDHAVDDGDVEVRALAGRACGAASAARIDMTACMPPAAPSPTVAPGIAGPPCASRPEQ